MRLVTTSASNDPESSWVAIDDFPWSVMVGDHLARLGHRDIAVLVETNQPAGSPGDSASMQPGFGTSTTPLASPACASRCQGVTIVAGGHNSIESGNTATIWLLDHERLPTAIVGLSDVLALGAPQTRPAAGSASQPTCPCVASTTSPRPKPPISPLFINRSGTKGNMSGGC